MNLSKIVSAEHDLRVRAWYSENGIALGSYTKKDTTAYWLIDLTQNKGEDHLTIQLNSDRIKEQNVSVEFLDRIGKKIVGQKIYVLAGYRDDDNGGDTDEPELCKTQAEAVEAMADSVIDFISNHVDVDNDTVCMDDFEEVGIFDPSNLDDEFKSKIKDDKVAIADIRSYIIRAFDVSAYVATSSSDREFIDLRIYEKTF